MQGCQEEKIVRHTRRYNPAMKHTILGAALAMMLCFAVTADAQWLKTKTPGIPRTRLVTPCAGVVASVPGCC